MTDLLAARSQMAMSLGFHIIFAAIGIAMPLLMAGQQIRRLPVLDKTRKLVGIVSIGDIAVHSQDHQLSGKILEDVSQPSMPKRGETTDQGDGVGRAA